MLFLALMVHTSFLNFVKMSDAYELHRMLFIYKHFVCKSEFFRSTARHASTSAEILQNNTVPAKTCHYCLTFCGREPFFLCLTDSCLTECKPANRIGPHELHLKGQKLLKASAQSELRRRRRSFRKYQRGTL